jgi:hypothetical protein
MTSEFTMQALRRDGKYQRYLDEFQQQFREKLKAQINDTVDLTFRDADVTVTFPYLGLAIRVDSVGRGIFPITRVTVRLDEALKGRVGDQRREIRSPKKTEAINLDRVIDAVRVQYQAVMPLYRLRKVAKGEIWRILGMDLREVENARQVRYRSHNLYATFRWETDYVAGSAADCCVGFELREPNFAKGYSNDRKLTWNFRLNEEIFWEKFKQQLQDGIDTWERDDQQALTQQAQRQNNETVVTQLRKDFQDMDCVSLEATPDSFRTVVWLKTETEIRALLEWLRNRPQPEKGV